MDLFDLYASLTLDTDGYETGMKNAKTVTTNAGDAALSAANGGFTVMKEVLANLTTSVITELISKCKELVTSVYEIGTETETSFAQLETIAGSENIDALTESLYDLSVQTGISSSDLALTAYNAISAGSSAEEAAEMVETAAKLATAGFTDTDSALSVLSTTINAYGMSAEDAAIISDSLIQVQNLGVTTVAELSSAMGKAISTASAYSIDLYNLEAAYISTTKAGISTEESTTYLSSMFNELGDSGSDVAAILSEETDMTFGQLMDSGYSLAEVLNILYESVDGDSEALMNLWGSAEAGKAASAIISQGLDTFADSLDAVSDAAGSTEEAYETMTDTLEFKVERLQTIGETMMLKLYEGAESQLKSVVDWASEAGIEILDAYEEGGISGAFDAAASIVAELILGFVTSFEENLPTIVATAANLVSAFATNITNNLPLLISEGAYMVSNILSGITESLPDVAVSATELVNNVVNGITGAIPSLADSAVQMISSWVSFLLENLPQVLSAGADIVVNLIQGIASVLPDLVSSAIELVTNIASSIIQNLPEILATGVSIVIELINGIVQTLPDLLMTAISLITSMLSSIGELLPEILAMGVELVLNLISGIISLLPNVINAAGELILGFIDAFTETDWLSVGTDIVSGIANGITNAFSTIVEAATNLGETILSTVQGFFGISSPSKLMAEQGEYLIQGLVEGANDLPKEVDEILIDTGVVITDWTDNLSISLSEWAILLFESAVEWLTTVQTTITEWADTVRLFISEWLTTVQTTITEWATVIWNLATEWLAMAQSTFEEWTSYLLELIANFLNSAQNSFEEGLATVAKLFTSGLENITSIATEWGSKIVEQFFTIGVNIIQGMINGIASMISTLYDSIVSALSGLVDTAKSALGISSPSKVFAAIGGYMAEGLGEGWNDEISDIKEDIAGELDFGSATIDGEFSAFGSRTSGTGNESSAALNIYSQAQTAADLLRTVLIKEQEMFEDGLMGVVGLLEERLREITDKVDEWGEDTNTQLYSIGQNMMQSMINGIDSNISTFTKNVASGLDFGFSVIDTSASTTGTTLGGASGRNSNMRGGISVVQNIYSQAQTAADLLREARWQQERAVMRGV